MSLGTRKLDTLSWHYKISHGLSSIISTTRTNPGAILPHECIEKEVTKISFCCHPCDQVSHSVDKVIRVC